MNPGYLADDIDTKHNSNILVKKHLLDFQMEIGFDYKKKKRTNNKFKKSFICKWLLQK